jgi:CDP-diacylglycerol pyrophosphatase
MTKRTRIRASNAVLALIALVAMGAGTAWLILKSNSDALWRIVSENCVPSARAGLGDGQCARVDLQGGYVVLKDRVGIAQYLLIPTARITGIESPVLWQGDGPNYWQQAWASRSFVDATLGVALGREDVGLVVNSRYGRTQDQLHIHIDCMRPDVVAALQAHRAALSASWSDMPERLGRHRYRARLIDGETLADNDPFRLLEADVAARDASMAAQTLLLTGTQLDNGRPGFILLSNQAGFGDLGSAESLLDHDGAVAGPGVVADR